MCFYLLQAALLLHTLIASAVLLWRVACVPVMSYSMHPFKLDLDLYISI